MLEIFNGQMNSGKTLAMSYFAFIDYLNGRTIYSNYHLNFPHKLINRDFIFMLGKEQPSLENSSFNLDELWIWLDCRDSIANTIATYFFLQSSKDDANIRLSSQSFSQNDKRIKENYHRLWICKRMELLKEKFKEINSEKRFLSPETIERLYIFATLFSRKNNLVGDLSKKGTLRLKASLYFNLYNTKEKIKKVL